MWRHTEQKWHHPSHRQLAYHTVLFTGDEGKRANYRHSHNLISSPAAARLAARGDSLTFLPRPDLVPASCSHPYESRELLTTLHEDATVSREREREKHRSKKGRSSLWEPSPYLDKINIMHHVIHHRSNLVQCACVKLSLHARTPARTHARTYA